MEENNKLQENVNYGKYSGHYSEEGFWDKVKKIARKAGYKVIYCAMQLYYTLQCSDTPAWAKTVIVGALGYFILPSDLVPDLMPAVGFTDDLGVLMAALATVAIHITPEIEQKAKDKAEQWFGDKQ